MAVNDSLDTNSSKQEKTGKMYLINQEGDKEVIDTFMTVAPKEL